MVTHHSELPGQGRAMLDLSQVHGCGHTSEKASCASPSSHRADTISRFGNVCVHSAVIIVGMMEI